MKHTEKFSAFETCGGTYSSRKIPPWRLGQIELMEYLDFVATDWDEIHYQNASA